MGNSLEPCAPDDLVRGAEIDDDDDDEDEDEEDGNAAAVEDPLGSKTAHDEIEDRGTPTDAVVNAGDEAGGAYLSHEDDGSVQDFSNEHARLQQFVRRRAKSAGDSWMSVAIGSVMDGCATGQIHTPPPSRAVPEGPLSASPAALSLRRSAPAASALYPAPPALSAPGSSHSPTLLPQRRRRAYSQSPKSWRALSARPMAERISRGGSRGCSLPQSELWAFQREFYAAQGVDSWQHGVVPSFASTNVRLAHGYARSIFEFVRARSAARSPPANTAYVLEFGAGAGKLGFHVASRLLELEKASAQGGARPTRIVYVLTEVDATSVAFWRSHSALQDLFQKGVLDLALVDAADPQGVDNLALQVSGVKLCAGQMDGPIVGICNYLFDSLEQDAFQVRDKVLYRAHVEVVGGLPHLRRGQLQQSALRAADNAAGDGAGSGRLESVWRPLLSWTYDLCDAAEDALLAREMLPDGSDVEREVLIQLLRRYQAEGGDLTVLVPLGAIRVVRNLLGLASDRADVLMIAADKGFHEVEEFASLEDPHMVMHGGVSFMTNFHLLNRFCERVYRSAHVRRTSHLDGFKAVAVMFGYDRSLRRCDAALDQLLHGFDPGQIATLHAWSTTRARVSRSDEALALLRASDHDQASFFEVKHVLDAWSLEPEARRSLDADLTTLMNVYYPLQASKDVAFETGRVRMSLGDFGQAADLFRQSLRDCGAHPVTWLNLGICHAYCDRFDEARAAFAASLDLDPNREEARSWLQKVGSTRDPDGNTNEGNLK